MQNDALYAYLPRWIVESPIPAVLERDIGAGAWSVYRAVLEEETARNVLPDRVFVELDDLVMHSGLAAERVRELMAALTREGFLHGQESAEGDGWNVSVVAPPPVELDREALVERLRGKKYAVRGVSFRYLDEGLRKTAWRELLDQYHAVFGAKINAAITGDLRALGEQFDPLAIREAFQEARREGAKSLSWVLTWLHRRADREYVPNVGRNVEGNPDDLIWRYDEKTGDMS